ncbi:hypothetical protein VTI74DRAFT_1119 [Chaetomium olivicolor]
MAGVTMDRHSPQSSAGGSDELVFRALHGYPHGTAPAPVLPWNAAGCRKAVSQSRQFVRFEAVHLGQRVFLLRICQAGLEFSCQRRKEKREQRQVASCRASLSRETGI